ncbi:barstar family protein [Micromonospora sp. NPDC047465]|uniref:barstar family protein n=1 Tax=Micromonospora sp. NPDC047465 TaxID=3154813 RepID=UPI0033F631B4
MTDEQADPLVVRWRWNRAVPLRWLLVDESTEGEPALAVCADIDGLFVETPSGWPGATLVGCQPQPTLRAALDALSRGAGNPGGALRRRRISASFYGVAADGVAARVLGAWINAEVTGVRPSILGNGLFDVTLDSAIADPMPTGARQIWDLWHAGRPAEVGLWARYDSVLRHQWAGAALAHHRPEGADKPAGATYHLDGRHITDLEGFYCAVGEAINGPGGYFGWNADALHDCTTGGWGAEWPFRLIWHDAEVARTHLAPDSGRRAASAPTFDQLLRWFAEDGIEVDLR